MTTGRINQVAIIESRGSVETTNEPKARTNERTPPNDLELYIDRAEPGQRAFH